MSVTLFRTRFMCGDCGTRYDNRTLAAGCCEPVVIYLCALCVKEYTTSLDAASCCNKEKRIPLKLKPSDLLLPYGEWRGVAESIMNNGDDETISWLNRWRMFDISQGVIADVERQCMRYGHWLGWFDKGESLKEA